jgi:hypothetical protein
MHQRKRGWMPFLGIALRNGPQKIMARGQIEPPTRGFSIGKVDFSSSLNQSPAVFAESN